jgi:tRNA modification GTPase
MDSNSQSYMKMDILLKKATPQKDTIVALSTPTGIGAIAVIRISGEQSLEIIHSIFTKDISQAKGHTAHFGNIIDAQGNVVDEVVATLFKAPRSYTKEDVVEISCHGSEYIIQKIIALILSKGARLALAGEFTQRAFLNGQLDLAQAEAVADLIAADSQASHQIALQQMRGGYSQKIKDLRENFIRLAALLELELDFSEEDVEFANRDELRFQLGELMGAVTEMADSFALGNVLKNGVPIAIVGKPNAGKSTLLNALLQEEKAIVTPIAGTTRDVIEDERVIQGVRFRFMDTAGLRETKDLIESMGIERTKAKIKEASLLLYLFDLNETTAESLTIEVTEIKQYNIPYLLIANKLDVADESKTLAFKNFENILFISASEKQNLHLLEQKLLEHIQYQPIQPNQVIVSNLRHYESLKNTLKALEQVQQTLDLNLSTELIASDMREAIYHLGSIVGEVSNEDLLDFIFSKFCIGK